LFARLFWDVVRALDREEQKKLMQFVTGSHRIPVEGLSCIEFKISKLPFPTSDNTNM